MGKCEIWPVDQGILSQFVVQYCVCHLQWSSSHVVLCPLFCREQPIYTTRAHVFQIDPTTKRNWVPASKQAVTVSYFHDNTRNSYRIISVDVTKVCVCVCVCMWSYQKTVMGNM